MQYFTPEEIKKNKDDIVKKFEIREGRRFLAIKGRNIHIFTKFIKEKGAKILDFGAGSGAFLKTIYELGYKNIYGLDIDNYLDKNIKPLVKELKLADASFDKFDWPDNNFDAVTAWEVFEHLENPHHAVREVHRILKPGGLLLMSIPNIFHIVSKLVFFKRGLFPRWNETNNHIAVFPHGIFEKTFLKYFNLIEEGYVHSRIALPGLYKISALLPENKWFGTWVYYVLSKK